QEGMGEAEAEVRRQEVGRRREVGTIHLDEWTPRERVPKVAPGDVPALEPRRGRGGTGHGVRLEQALAVPLLDEQRGSVQEDVDLGVDSRHTKPVELLP